MAVTGTTLSLIPELEDVIQHGTRAKRVDALQRITALFLDGASRYSDEHIDLFDDVFSLLIVEIENQARAELSGHLAPVRNAPVKVLRTLANDDDIAVAGPVLKLAPRLAEADLIGVAQTKSQAHLHAISARSALGEAVTVTSRGASPTTAARAFLKTASSASSSAPKTTASSPRRSGCGPTSPSRSFTNC
jgi:uncharacterized protein (DUF2336 family)